MLKEQKGKNKKLKAVKIFVWKGKIFFLHFYHTSLFIFFQSMSRPGNQGEKGDLYVPKASNQPKGQVRRLQSRFLIFSLLPCCVGVDLNSTRMAISTSLVGGRPVLRLLKY